MCIIKKIQFLIILSITVFFLSSCKKSIENQIDGAWKLSNIDSAGTNEFEEWYFNKGNFSVVLVKNDGSHIQRSVGEYIIIYKLKNLRRVLSVTKSTNSALVDDWKITKLTANFLTLRHSEGSILLEFTKE